MEEGLRERKKRETRERIADVAMGLFIARGFDNVTVAEVARAADVSVNTVFNYFATKEDLFLDRGDDVSDLLARVVRARRPGESALEAVRRDFLAAMDERDWRYGLHEGAEVFAKIARESSSLQGRLLELRQRRTKKLAEVLALESDTDPDDLRPMVVAAQIGEAIMIMTRYFLMRRMAGEDTATILETMRPEVLRVFAVLENGLGGYCRKPAGIGTGADGTVYRSV